jgi:hypothetical protein
MNKGKYEEPVDHAMTAIEAIKYNAGMYLELAKYAMEFEGLTFEDREAIKLGVRNLELGLRFIDCNSPDELRDAALRLMTGAELVGERATCCESEKEYWRRKYNAKGGQAKNPATKAWQDWATAIIAQSPELKASQITDSLLAEKTAPKCLPESYEHLIKFVRKTRKQFAANKGKIRLVHSA